MAHSENNQRCEGTIFGGKEEAMSSIGLWDNLLYAGHYPYYPYNGYHPYYPYHHPYYPYHGYNSYYYPHYHHYHPYYYHGGYPNYYNRNGGYNRIGPY